MCKFPQVRPRHTLLCTGKEVRRATVNKGFPGGASGQEENGMRLFNSVTRECLVVFLSNRFVVRKFKYNKIHSFK